MPIFVSKTREQRRRENHRLRLEKERQRKKELEEFEKKKKQYPPLIMTISKRLERIDPWNSVARLSPWDCSYITYYKLKQFGFSEGLRIVTTAQHAWVEFKFNNEWWIFDPTAVRKINLGDALKRKKYNQVEEYLDMQTVFDNVEDYVMRYDKKITYEPDEAKILAMSDDGLNSVLRIKYH
jgi:hypothetical protein